jgi:hypothetical protein
VLKERAVENYLLRDILRTNCHFKKCYIDIDFAATRKTMTKIMSEGFLTLDGVVNLEDGAIYVKTFK